ncbi:MAG: hypothetical protein ABR987_17415, partial [Terracidiphilus sp.]
MQLNAHPVYIQSRSYLCPGPQLHTEACLQPTIESKKQAHLESKSASTARLEEIRKTVAENYAPLAHN